MTSIDHPGASSGPVATPLRHAEAVMGTVVSFTLHPAPGLGERELADLVRHACAGLHRDDRTFSTWMPGSPMSRHRAGALAATDLPPDIVEVLERCQRLRSLTGGWFDPWAMPGGVDPTGMVKGWAAQRALDALVAGGAGAAMVNAGGDLCTSGSPPGADCWRVGIRHPWQPAAFAAVVAVRGAVATSGDYERPGQLLDPRTGRAARASASATVTGPDLAQADALATALAVGGTEVLSFVEAVPGYEAYLIGTDGDEASTAGMAFIAAPAPAGEPSDCTKGPAPRKAAHRHGGPRRRGGSTGSDRQRQYPAALSD